MGVILASAIWLKHWDGLPEHCWRAEHEKSLERQEVQVRLERLDKNSSLGGFVLKGSRGAGKREILRVAFQRPDFPRLVTWISGSDYGSNKSYGAIQFLLTDLEDSEIESPLAVYGLLKRYFSSFDEQPLIIMDNIAVIDPFTIAVFCQLVSNNIIQLIILDDLAEPLSEDISSLVRSGLFETFQLSSLTLTETRTQVSLMLEANISYLSTISLWNYSAGNSETLRAVVLDCRDAGLFEKNGEAARLNSYQFPTGIHMEQYVAGRLDRINLEQRKLLEQIALSGTISQRVLSEQQKRDVDFMYARGLLEHSRGLWKVANPAIARTLTWMQNDSLVWEQAESPNVENQVRLGTKSNNEARLTCQPLLGQRWLLKKQQAVVSASDGNTDIAITLIEDFLANDSAYLSQSNGRTPNDWCDANLYLLELCLASSRLTRASTILLEFEPTNPVGNWSQLNLCQQYRVLAYLTEYLSRTNEHHQAEELLAALLKPLNYQFEEGPEYRISECMESSLRSLINIAMTLGKWELARGLVRLVLSGSLGNLQLVAYAETVHAVMLAFAGNFVEAQKIIDPLHLQVQINGPKSQRVAIEAMSIYISNHCAEKLLGKRSRIVLEEPETVPMLGSQGFWQSISLVARREYTSAEIQRTSIEKMAQRAENHGELLVASHLWATVIRHGGFHVAPRLRRLQDGHEHKLAVAFKTLSDGAQDRDSQLLAAAVGSLARLGYVTYATDDGAKIFDYMNAGQRRQASRKANEFMTSLQPNLVRPDIYAGLGRITVLTDRERFVASAAASGLTNLEIAEQASVSVRTVEGHLYQVYSKLGISKRGELYALTDTQCETNTGR